MNLEQPHGLEQVIINSALQYRPARTPDHEAENKALIALARTLADSPDKILQRLVETALQLCRADTAGISLLEEHNGAEVFRWEALAGVFSDRLNATMPRNASPCGTTIDRNATQLMYMAERVFPALTSQPPVVEALLIPFHVENKPIGTVWVVAHDEGRKFDQEDERIIKTLAEFAAASWQLWKARTEAQAAAQKERQRISELAAANKALEAYIANRTRVEQELQQLNKELQARISEKSGELSRANADLIKSVEQDKKSDGQQSENINTLTAGLAHDLNNILNIIQGYATLIMSHPDEPSSVIEDAEVITTTVAEAVALSRELIAAGQQAKLKFEFANINDVIRRLTNALKKTFPPTIEISLDLDSQLPTVVIHSGHINRAILNLCINARDAIVGRGSIVIHTRTIPGGALSRRFPGAGQNRHVCISVSDTGIGMEADTKSQIFDSGFTTKDGSQGAGLGLSMVNDIVTDHHGFIEVTSESGRGSIFSIYLPITEAARLPLSPALQENIEARSPPTTILYAEDETRLTELMQPVLEREGFKVLTAKDGDEAIQLHRLHKHEIALAILDSGLAKVNGWEVFQEMKKDNPNLKVILASGYISAEAEARVANREVSGVLQKPYGGEEILAMIRRIT